jgi:hypothetical protein
VCRVHLFGSKPSSKTENQGWQSGLSGTAPARKCVALSSNPSTPKKKKRENPYTWTVCLMWGEVVGADAARDGFARV